ncbi:hypothetical protein GH714_030981 [Hevea brasiliensis]|uniref:Uncharacterized protein n=1 Tax=Hevea brasiliensis TaxID=3981 RepID=A0A6A6LDW6_HEVBR|nr:hypothetical protein GH714_030981 [Hevea brasiliensis]
MGRLPCCDKLGVKKGPWTPEEDIMLVSYIQEHGPGNWRAVPTNTGLLRCSKSCRLRWTNYLRPGIKRGHEGDSKNELSSSSTVSKPISRGQWERRLQTDIHTARQALYEALSPEKKSSLFTELKHSSGGHFFARPASNYASSTENIAKLLKGWMRNGPKKQAQTNSSAATQNSFNNIAGTTDSICSEGTGPSKGDKNGIELAQAFESLFGFESLDSSISDFSHTMSTDEASLFQDESKPYSSDQMPPLSLLEKWLLDEGALQGKNYLGEVTLDENNLF